MTSKEFTIGDVDRLQSRFRARMPGFSDLRLTKWERVASGHSNDTFRVAVEHDGTSDTFIIRRDIVHGIMEPYDIAGEFRLLQALNRTEVRAPRVYWLEEDPSVMGAIFYVMEECAGRQPPDHYTKSGLFFDASPAERRVLHTRFLEQLAAIHTLDWRALGLSEMGSPLGFDFEGPPRDGTDDCADRAVVEWVAKAEANQIEPEPLFVEPVEWLRRHRPVTPRVTLTHGDCKLSNYMFADAGVSGIFDWEWARLSDPMWDLAWSGFVGNRPAGYLDGMLMPEEFCERYEALTGILVRPESIRYFDAIAELKKCSFFPAFGRVFQEGISHDLRYGGMAFSTHSYLVALNRACGLLPAVAPASDAVATVRSRR